MNTIKKYVWLIETINNAKRITFEEISQKWTESELSDGMELPLRTFHKWRIAAEDLFDIDIECDRNNGYVYYISNAEEIKNGTLRKWLLNSISVSNLILDNVNMKNQILLEEIPSGKQYLEQIITSMRLKRRLLITYKSYWKPDANSFEIEPYCIKLFNQRWYLVARNVFYDRIMIYSLDRIQKIENTASTYSLPDNFNPKELFKDYFGIVIDSNVPKEKVKLKVSAGKSNFFRSLPLHSSQNEVETNNEFSIFELTICPSYDFIMEIMKHGHDVEILEPAWLRQEVKERILNTLKIYQ